MKLFSISAFLLSLLLAFSSCSSQLKNVKTENVKILGNCGVCETTIINAGSIENKSQIQWNKDTKIAVLTYDSIKTNQGQILKLIALAGYDNEQFLAPDDVYSKLPDCCRYNRVNKSAIVKNENIVEHSIEHHHTTTNEIKVNQLDAIFENYFALKDALVNSDPKLSSSIAKTLLTKIKEVNMEQLSDEHTVWMNIMSSLLSNTELVSKSTNIEKQRNIFMTITADVYKLMKVSKQDASIYYQHCPMYNSGKGSNWLSKEKEIKNPYYGSQMLNCGKVIETIK